MKNGERLSNRQIVTLKHLAITCANGGQVTLTRARAMSTRAVIRYWSPANPNWWSWHRFLCGERVKRGGRY